MKYALSDFTTGIETILRSDAHSVTVFCAPKNPKTERIRVTRKTLERSGKQDNTLVITFGKPNYKEREFLRLCKKAKTHPKKTWLQFRKKK